MSDGYAPLSLRLGLLGFALEAASGTAETVTAAMAGTVVYDAKMSPEGLFDGGESRPMGNYGGTRKRSKGPEAAKLTFLTELHYGDQTMGLLQCSGFAYLAGPPKGATAGFFDLATQKTGTFVLWEGGRKKTMYGASISSCKIAPESSGQKIMLDWEAMGVWGGAEAASMPSDATVSTAAMRSAGITLTEDGAEVPQVSGWEINLGMETNPRQDATAAKAIQRYQVEDGNPTLKLDPEARLVADYDAFGLLLAGGEHAVVLTAVDGAGNNVAFSMPRAQRLSVQGASRDKKRVDEVAFACPGGSADAGIVITETAAAYPPRK